MNNNEKNMKSCVTDSHNQFDTSVVRFFKFVNKNDNKHDDYQNKINEAFNKNDKQNINETKAKNLGPKTYFVFCSILYEMIKQIKNRRTTVRSKIKLFVFHNLTKYYD